MDKIKVFSRSSLFFFCFVVGIFLFALLLIFSIPVTTLARRRRFVNYWARFNLFILDWCCGLTVRVSGLNNLPSPPYMILCKHQSAWETVTLQAIFPEAVLILKKSLLNIPFFGWGIMASGQIAIDRSQGVKALRLMGIKCQQAFDSGNSVLIFPEGTRVAPGEVGKYNPGGIGMALSSGVPIVPVAHNAGLFWERKAFLKKPGEIQLCIAPPIPTTGLGKADRKALNLQVQDAIEGMMAQIAG
ncbi:MAG: 1-acyl-sn-glycerol-3-phosphate acyltransferase [Magnetococcales bacterium]|nr:1-acyl-sn-glycerol-3-phosphate acyltransferase [Magnetococcales bacterium]